MLFPEEERISKQEDIAVLNLSLQLPIGFHLQELKTKIVPIEKIKRFGPKDGRVAYAFTYKKRARLLSEGLRLTEDIFGVVLDGSGSLSIWNKRCAKNSGEWMESTNPLDWAGFYYEAVSSRKQMEARKEKPKMDVELFKGMAIRELPGLPMLIGAEILMEQHENEIFIRGWQEMESKEKAYKQGNLRGMILIENINSEAGFQQFSQALVDFHQSFKKK